MTYIKDPHDNDVPAIIDLIKRVSGKTASPVTATFVDAGYTNANEQPGGGVELAHTDLPDMPSAIIDDHTLYSRVDGLRAFTATVGGIDPAASSDLATKNYVDNAIAIVSSYFLNDTASDIGGIYYEMRGLPTGEAESSFTKAALGAGAGQALYNFATIAGVPGITNLRHGIYDAHIHAAVTAGTKPVTIYFELYTRTAAGAETLRATSEVSAAITTKATVELHATIANDVTINDTDRIVVKFLANVAATGSDATVVIYAEGDNASHVEIPTTSDILSEVFVRQDGTKPFVLGSDAEGDIWYRGATGIERLGIGTAGQLVATNSGATAPEWVDASAAPLHTQVYSLVHRAELGGVGATETDMNCRSEASDTYGGADGTTIESQADPYDWTNHRVIEYTSLKILNKGQTLMDDPYAGTVDNSGQIAFWTPIRKLGTSVVITARIRRSGTSATGDAITTLYMGCNDLSYTNDDHVSKLVSAVSTSWETWTTTAIDVSSYDTEIELFFEMSTSAYAPAAAGSFSQTSTINVHEILVQQY